MAAHSKVVGGSTAKRVINCPGSVVLVQRMPPQVESKYAAEGTLLHSAAQRLMDTDDTLGAVAADLGLNDDQREKLTFCVDALDQIDPKREMTYVTEQRVGFTTDTLARADAFGSADMIGRIGNRAVVLDWKFGDGVMVEAEENEQGLFYAAAAMETPAAQWAFRDAAEIEIIIVQPPHIRRWVTTPARVAEFRAELSRAVALALKPDAPLSLGDHCRWCTAKPICPQMTGAIERLEHGALETLDADQLGRALTLADKLESFIADARAVAQQRLEKSLPVAGYKLVPKRATRQWASEAKTVETLTELGLTRAAMTKTELLSPAQMEKVLKKSKLALPDDLVVAVSSGNTIAPESDPRPAAVLIGQQLTAALSKLQ